MCSPVSRNGYRTISEIYDDTTSSYSSDSNRGSETSSFLEDQAQEPDSVSRVARQSDIDIEEIQENPETRLWCHIAGRISCLVRIPFYAIAATWQFPKIVIKTIFSAIQLAVNIPIALTKVIINCFRNCFGYYPLEHKIHTIRDSWSLRGVVRDIIVCGSLSQRVINSAWLFFVAPPKYYVPMQQAVKACFKSMSGCYHMQNEYPTKVKTFLDIAGSAIPNYWRQITPSLRGNSDHENTYCGHLING